MANDRDIRIVEWPPAPLALSHAFGRGPLALNIGGAALGPIDLRMLVASRGVVPLCLSLCEAICATSDYTIGITVFDKPIVTIRIQGQTRLFVEE